MYRKSVNMCLCIGSVIKYKLWPLVHTKEGIRLEWSSLTISLTLHYIHNNHFITFQVMVNPTLITHHWHWLFIYIVVHDRSRSFVLGHLCLVDITTCSYEETKVYSMTSCICIIALSDAVIDGTSKYHHDSW